jgi:hypothetical protein
MAPARLIIKNFTLKWGILAKGTGCEFKANGLWGNSGAKFFSARLSGDFQSMIPKMIPIL